MDSKKFDTLDTFEVKRIQRRVDWYNNLSASDKLLAELLINKTKDSKPGKSVNDILCAPNFKDIFAQVKQQREDRDKRRAQG